jgi:predicted transcriptional regulator
MAQNATTSREMHDKMQGFNKQLGEYNEHMEKINSKYRDFLAGSK